MLTATRKSQTVEVEWEFHEKQTQALDTIDLPECEVLTYGGAKGGGKSVLGCREAVLYAEKVIELFDIEPTKQPLAIGFLGRKQGTDFNHTTLETFKQYIDKTLYRINENKKQIIIRERVAFDYGGLDKQVNLNKFNSAEYGFIFIDQAEEISEDEFGKLFATLRMQINGTPLPFKMLLSCNPAPCWIKRRIIKNANREKEGLYFIQALPDDNPFLTRDYKEKLTKAFRHRPELLAAYLHGCWDELEGADLIIKDLWVQQSHLKTLVQATNRRLITCDPARFGDDRTVIYYLIETEICDDAIYGQKDTHYTSGKIAAMANKYRDEDGIAPVIVVDGTGLGAGIADNLIAWGFDVIVVQGAEQASAPEMFGNLRAEIWWTAGQKYSDGDIVNHYKDDELDTELTVPKYFYRNGRVYVEAKEDIKKPDRYGKSPDKADCYTNGVFYLDAAAAIYNEKKKNLSGTNKTKKHRSAMAS